MFAKIEESKGKKNQEKIIISEPIGELGNKTKSSPPAEDVRRKIQENRAVRYKLLASARSIYIEQGFKEGLRFVQNYHRTAKCKHVPTGQTVGVNASKIHKSAFYSGLVSCGSVWTCAVCSVKIQECRRQEIEIAINTAYAKNLQPVLVTLTFPHRKTHKLDDLLKMQADALARLRKGKQWDKCNDPLKSCSGDNHERESHEHDDGRRIQAVDSQAQGGIGHGNHSGEDQRGRSQPGIRYLAFRD